MCVPREEGVLDVLRRLRKQFDFQRNAIDWDTVLPPVFCIRLNKTWGLFSFCRSERNDRFGRSSFAFQGLLVEHANLKEFASILPYIVDDYRNLTNPLKYIEVDDYDSLDGHSFTYDLSFQELIQTPSERLQALKCEEYQLQRKASFSIAHDNAGFQELLSYLVSPHMPLFEFAFGIVPGTKDFFTNTLIRSTIELSSYISTQRSHISEINIANNINRPEPLIGVDVCRVVLEEMGIKKWFMKTQRHRYRFVTESVQGTLTAPKSVDFESKYSLTDLQQLISYKNAPNEVIKALGHLLNQLSSEGWQREESKGQFFWNYVLKRPKQPIIQR